MSALTRQELRAMRQLLALLLHERPALAPGPRPSSSSLPVEFVRAQLLAPQAYRAGYGVFESDYMDSRLYVRMHRECLAEVSAALGARGISVVLMGGAQAALELYADAALRPLGCIDLLVRPDELSRVIQLLGDLGYEGGSPRRSSGAATAASMRRGQGESEARIALGTVMRGPSSGRFDLGGAWRRARAEDADRPALLQFQPIDQLLGQVSYLAHHHLRVPLVRWTDMARAIRRLDRAASKRMRGEARSARLGPALAVTRAMNRVLAERGSRLPRRSRAAAVMPRVDEVIGQGAESAALRRVRDAALLQGAGDLAGLAVSRLRSRGGQ